MLTLAIDTAAGRCAIALWRGSAEDGTPVGEACADMARGHAEALFPMLQTLMAAHGLAPAAIGRIAVVTGPGSFSGIRVGLAAARGLALALARPAVGVSVFEWLAAAHAGDREGFDALALAIDARRGEIYLDVLAAQGAGPAAPLVATPEAAAPLLPRGQVAVAGSGAERLRVVAEASGRSLTALPTRPLEPMLLARLGAAREAAGRPPRPLYIRPPDAKPQTRNMLRRPAPAESGA